MTEETKKKTTHFFSEHPGKAVGYNFLLSLSDNLGRVIYVFGLIYSLPYIRDTIIAHVGESTEANYNIGGDVSVTLENIDNWIIYIIGSLLIIIGLLVASLIRSNSTKKKQSKRLGELQDLMMQNVDKDRGTSNLTKTGKTNPTDI